MAYLATTPPVALTPLGAQMHVVEVAWRLRSTREVSIGPRPVLALALRARRDVELLTLRVDYPELGNHDKAGCVAEAVLAQVPHVVGLRRIEPEGEPWVWGQEGIDALPMVAGDREEERAKAPDQVRWWGDVVECVEYNRNPAPCIWWAWRGRVSVPRGVSVGVIVRADVATYCRVSMAGV